MDTNTKTNTNTVTNNAAKSATLGAKDIGLTSKKASSKKSTAGAFAIWVRVLLQNVASSILLTLNDLTRGETYDSIDSILQVFLKENRILYLGMFLAVLAIFIFLFFG